jgi:methionyl-tRNA formyltransferase
MRLVLLIGHSREGELQHRYVAARLIREFPSELCAIIVATGSATTLRQKVRKWLRRLSLSQLTSRIAVRVWRKLTGYERTRNDKYGAVLFPDKPLLAMPGDKLIKRVVSHNDSHCRQLICELKPDIVVVYGTLVIGQKLISSLPRTLNMHTGLSPRYRGSDTIFWPLYNHEPENIGVTIHYLDAGLDSGAILARGCPETTSTDDEFSLFAKSVKFGAELLCNAIRRETEGASRPIGQDLSTGREYRSVDRTLLAEFRMRKALKAGLLGKGAREWSEEF